MTTIYDADILLVDDNPDLLALVADNLHTAGYKTVRTAASCADAKTAFARRRPELMILDINLPDGDGFGLFRDLTVDLQDAAVHRADGTAALTATERAILQKLADERGHIVTYDALCEAVWGADYYGYENSLNVHIRHLREKIEADPGRPQWLVTARGIGYKLAGEM